MGHRLHSFDNDISLKNSPLSQFRMDAFTTGPRTLLESRDVNDIVTDVNGAAITITSLNVAMPRNADTSVTPLKVAPGGSDITCILTNDVDDFTI